MGILVHVVILVALFLVLGKAADVIVSQLRPLSRNFGLRDGVLGVILGLFTTTPEFALGMHAVANQVNDIALGNLMGGIIVELGLILGIGLILQRKIVVHSVPERYVLGALGFLVLPLILALDGSISYGDGAVLVMLYPAVVYGLGRHEKLKHAIGLEMVSVRKSTRHLLVLLVGVVVLLGVSNLIMHETLYVISHFAIPTFLIGLIVFSIGTNLPEIILTLRTGRKANRQISFFYLLGSALANILLIGFFALLQPFVVTSTVPMVVVMVFVPLLVGLVAIFQRTDFRLTRSEGVALVGVYVAFVVSQALAISFFSTSI